MLVTMARKIITTVLAALSGLFGLSSARGAENPHYDPDYDPDVQTVHSDTPMYDPDAPEIVVMTFEGVTPYPDK